MTGSGRRDRQATGAALLLAAALSWGCAPPPAAPCLEPTPELAELDFEVVRYVVNVANDVTDLNNGFRLEQELRDIYERDGWRAEFVRLDRFFYKYLILTNDTLGEQQLVFSGTTSIPQLLLDGQTELVFDEELGINLHRGWREGVNLGRATIGPRLRRDYGLTFIGFSLGAAGATISAMYAQNDGLDVRAVLTTGMPRITDETGVEWIEALPLVRIVAADDSVPWWPGPPYRSAGPAIILLDGPYICALSTVDAGAVFNANDPVDIEGLTLVDHLSYPLRIAEKTVGGVCNVPFAERRAYLTRVGD